MATTARLGIDITATDRTRTAFGSTQRNLAALQRSANQIKGAFAGIVGGNLLAGGISGLIRFNAQVKPVADSFERLKAALQDFALRAGESGLNQALISFSRNIALMITGTDGLAKSIGGFVAGGIRALEGLFLGIGRAMGFAYDNFEILKNAFIAFAAVAVAQRILGISVALVQLLKAIRAVSIAMALLHLIKRRLLVVIVGAAVIVAKLTGTYDKLTEALNGVWDAAAKLIPTIGESVGDALKKMGFDISALTEDFDKFGAQLASLPAVTDGGASAVQKFAKSYKVLDGNLKETEKSGFGLREEFRTFFTDLNSGVAPLDALNSALGRLQQRLLDMALDNAFNFLGGLFQSAPALPGVGPGGMGFMHFGGPRAEGGPVSRGKAYLVGEKRPELFVPNQSGTIVPRIPQRSGGSGGNVYISNRGAEVEAKPRQRSDGTRDWIIQVRSVMAEELANPYSDSSVALGARGVKNAVKRR